MKFDGSDWCELAKHFGVFIDEIESDCEPLAEYLKDNRESLEVEKVCREFLDALIKQSKKHTYLFPLWDGLGQIEDGFTFMEMFIHLLPAMWV
jgi:hypothetical protein